MVGGNHIIKFVKNIMEKFEFISTIWILLDQTKTKVVHKNISQGGHKIEKSKIKKAMQPLHSIKCVSVCYTVAI